MEELYIIAGLGNPGGKYDNTRHNIGFEAVDMLAAKHNIRINKIKFKGVYGTGEISGKKVLLLKPQTYMNLSGESIREALAFYKVPLQNLLVLYDDIDLPVGKLRVRARGSSGSHNGMKSIIYQLAQDTFPRVRIGVGKPPEGWDLADYVPSRFLEEEKKCVAESVENACSAIKVWLENGIEPAMNRYNQK